MSWLIVSMALPGVSSQGENSTREQNNARGLGNRLDSRLCEKKAAARWWGQPINLVHLGYEEGAIIWIRVECKSVRPSRCEYRLSRCRQIYLDQASVLRIDEQIVRERPRAQGNTIHWPGEENRAKDGRTGAGVEPSYAVRIRCRIISSCVDDGASRIEGELVRVSRAVKKNGRRFWRGSTS
jgi:hypothetical protein